MSYVDFTITFEGDDNQTIDDVNSGIEAINGGLGIAVTKSWGMIDNRTISAITPVDERTSDVRFMVYIGRTPGKDAPRHEAKAQEFGEEVIRQFEPGRPHLVTPTLFGPARALPPPSSKGSPRSASGPSSSIPTARGGSAAELQSMTRGSRCDQKLGVAAPLDTNQSKGQSMNAPVRVFQVATGNVGSEMIKRHRQPHRPGTCWSALLFAREDRP